VERERKRELFQRGLAHFNRREFFTCHEVLEEIWLEETEEEKPFYQGLIQLAAGYVKLQQRHYKGALANLRKGLERFRELDDAVGDVEVPIRYKKLVNQSRGVRVSLIDQGEARVLERPWDLWPRIEYRAPGEPL